MRKLGLILVVLAACGGGKSGAKDGSVGDGGGGDGGRGDGGGDGGGGSAALSASPGSKDFGTVNVGSSSAVTTVTLSNTGTATTGQLALVRAGDTASFAGDGDTCSGHALAAGATCTLMMHFAPASFGPKAMSVTLSAPDSASTATITVTGTGRDQVALTVVQPFGGNGTGAVAGGPITCPGTCSAMIPRTDATPPMVVLTATPGTGSDFTSWGGACSGTTPTCTVTLSAAASVSATFTKKRFTLHLAVTLSGGASGATAGTPSDFSCNAGCTQTVAYDYGTVVTLTATPAGVSYVKAWTGDCTALSSTCMVTMTQDRTVGLSYDKSVSNFMFVTGTKVRPGSLGTLDPMSLGDGLRGGDAYCQSAAVAGGLGGSYRAFLSTSTTDAITRLGSARGWVRRDGLPFADTISALFNSAYVYYSPSVDEHGNQVGGVADVATGTGRSGVVQGGGNCAAWTSTTGNAALGNSSYGADGWTDFTITTTGSCGLPYRLYCFGTDLSAPLTYTHATGRLAFLSSRTMQGGDGVPQADGICASEAAAAALTGSYRALIGTSTSTPGGRFSNVGAPWVRTDGVALVASAGDLLTGAGLMESSLNINASGQSSTSTAAWMGSNGPVQLSAVDQSCSDWTSASASMQGLVVPSYLGRLATLNSFECDIRLHVFCLQQ